MTYASQKEGDGQHCELKAGQRLIEQLPDLTNALVTTDALHCQSRMSQQIVERGGEFIIQAKDNRKSSHKAAADLTKSLPPFLPSAQKGMAE
jgi:predicted transposase YbfD/YdcC